LPNLITWASFTILYLTLPNCPVKVRHALCGGFVAMVLFAWAKFGFSWYLVNFPSYELLYGALATIPIFLLWLYLTWIIILLGAIVSYVIANGIEMEV
jgi:membrane protein